MIIFVFGGSGSGKSAFAEQYIMQWKQPSDQLYYLATMQSCDEECERKIHRHRILREEKAFITLEQPYDIDQVSFGMKMASERLILLESLTTLLSNEIYRDGSYREVADRVWKTILALAEKCRQLVVVSDDVFRSGEIYSKETCGYVRQLGNLHQKIAEKADVVYEVVAGIPVCVKGAVYEDA